MSLTQEDLAAAGYAITGREVLAPSDTCCIKPTPKAMSLLSSLHEAAGHLAKTAPDILVQPEVARAMERRLCMRWCGVSVVERPPKLASALRRHAAVMRRFEQLLESNPDQTLYTAELCTTVGASERTLRACCQEHLGMSPTRYLWLRRMHLARRDLRATDTAVTSVTEVATSYGFWELGRFAVAYRSLFGESPSTTLRRPPDLQPQKNIGSPWQLPGSA